MWTVMEKPPAPISPDPWAVAPKRPAAPTAVAPPSDLSMDVLLSIRCESLRNRDVLSKSDPYVLVSTFPRGTPRDGSGVAPLPIGRTEKRMDTLNPQFTTAVPVRYRFEELQLMSFQVWDSDDIGNDFLGGVRRVELSRIVAAGPQGYRVALEGHPGVNYGFIVVVATPQRFGGQFLVLRAHASKLKKMDTFSKTDGFLKISRWNGTRFVLVHQTEVVEDSLNPRWKDLEISLDLLCGGEDKRTRILVECFDEDRGIISRSEEYMGEFETTVDELTAKKTASFELMPIKLKKKNSYGTLHLEAEVRRRPNYVEFLRGGCSVDVRFAIDFTGSNGDPKRPDSLHHYVHGGGYNQYMTVMERIASIVLPLDSDGMVRLSGFGGLVENCLSFFFPLAANGNFEVRGIDGMFAAYLDAIQRVPLSGPTNLAETIKHSVPAPCTASDLHYTVLVVLTDGEITDETETIREIVRACDRPLSIVVVGVGSSDFGFLERLDGDDVALQADGVQAKRDIVQFVPFRKHANNPVDLTSEVLAEIPRQLEQYMRARGLVPHGFNQLP